MDSSDSGYQDHYFLPQTSEMAVAIFSFQWQSTVLGDLRDWPLALKQSLNIILNSAVPTLIFWGEHSHILYNDAFQPYTRYFSHVAPGIPLTETDTEFFNGFSKTLEKVKQGRASIINAFQFKNDPAVGRFDVYCSAVHDESGLINGMIAQFIYTSAVLPLDSLNEELAASNEELQVINEELLATQNEQEQALALVSLKERQMAALVESAPFPIAVYLGEEMRISQANKSLIDVWGKGDDIIGKTYFEVLPELANQNIFQQLSKVYQTGIPYHVRNQQVDLLANGEVREFYFNYSFTPLFDQDAKVYGVMNTAADVTDLNLVKKQLEYSEKNFRNMILQAPVAMCRLKGADFVVEVVNDAMLEIWGKPFDKVIGKPIFEALPDAKEQGLEAAMSGVYETGQPFFASEQPVSLIRHGQPETVYQNFVYQPYRDSDGSIQGILAISVNVTEQVLSRLELQKAYERIQLSKEAAQLGTFDMDLLKGTMEWDLRCRELFGLDHHDEVSYEKDFVPGLHPDDRKRITELIDRLFDPKQGNGDYDVEYRTIGTKDGQLRWVRAKGKVYFEEHVPLRFIGSVMDITSQKNHELQLAEYSEKVKELSDKKDEFIALASHELKTPLASIHGYLQIMERLISNEQQKKFMTKASQQVLKLTSLVNDLLDISKIEAGKLKFNITEYDLHQVVTEAVELLQYSAEKHEIIFHTNTAECILLGDGRRIEQVIINLLTNAIKYSPAASKVEVSLKAAEHEVLISVRDFGPGVPSDKLQSIFTRFFRLDEATPNISGLGIGLYLAKEIVSRHQGAIWAESELGKGSVFYVSLPAGTMLKSSLNQQQ